MNAKERRARKAVCSKKERGGNQHSLVQKILFLSSRTMAIIVTIIVGEGNGRRVERDDDGRNKASARRSKPYDDI